MKEFDKIYIAKYYEDLGVGQLSRGFCSKAKIEKTVKEMKDIGIYEIYKSIDEYEWEKLENRTDKYIKEKYLKVLKEKEQKIFKELLEVFKVPKPQFKIFNEEKWIQKGIEDKNLLTEVDEIWKKIPNFEYSVSTKGRFRNDKSGKFKNPRYHKWMLQIDLYKNGKRITCSAPRLIANAFIRKVKATERVSFIDGDNRNIYYKNLKIVSK